MDKVNYMLYYKDDFNNKHITFCRDYKDVKFYKERFGKENVSVEICDYRNDSNENAAGRYNGNFVY